MSRLMVIQNQLLATKFFVPVASHPLISRPRLNALLQESLNRPLTVISTPAGFGKTMLLAAWGQSLSSQSNALLGWVSLDEEDNEPVLFWINALMALSTHQPERFTPLLKYLQSPETPPLKYVLTALINLLVDSPERFVLVLDDYHMITEQQIHTTLAYLVEHLCPQLHIILATRTDPPLPLSLLHTREQVLQVHADQLRCTAEETKAFLQQVMDIQLPDETIQEVTNRTEGWLVGLQLLGLSLPGCPDPATILNELSGDQRYISDFLTEEVLQRQSQEVQTFLLSTCILEQFTAPLCDAIMEKTGSQRMLEQLERANLFVVSLDNRRQWYRYHALFAEALRNRLEHTQADLVPILHHRASLWYAQHNQATQAILHAFSAHQWQWAGDLIERLPVISLTWGAGDHERILLRQWLERLPADVVNSRPRLCLACAQILWESVPPTMLQAWLGKAATTLTASLMHEATSSTMQKSQAQKEQENILGEVIAWRALGQCCEEDGATILALCQQALSLLSEDNALIRAYIAFPQMVAYYSFTNDAVAAVDSALYGGRLAQKAGYTVLTLGILGTSALFMVLAGRLHEAYQLIQQLLPLGTQPGGFMSPDVGLLMVLQAAILCEWNQLDEARSLVEEAILVCKQVESTPGAMYVVSGYAILAHICLARGELEVAHSALLQVEHVGQKLSQPLYLNYRSFYTIIDQVRFWLASRKLDRAMEWTKELDLAFKCGTPLAREREEVARARILLATQQPAAALQRLEPVLERATVGQRWSDVIEIRLLQALAHQMCYEETEALSVLSEAVRLAEPEGYIRRFVDEGAPMAALLSRLREQRRESEPTPYLDTLLAAFPQERKARKRQPKQAKRPTVVQL